MPRIPYTWLNPVLAGTSTVFLVVSVALLAFSFFAKIESRKFIRVGALCSFLLAIVAGASVYGLIFWIQLPSFAKQTREAHQQTIDEKSIVHVGDKFPAFRIKTTDGADVDMEQLRGKVVVVGFFATWCGPCLSEMPHLQEIWDANNDRQDFVMLVIGREETPETLSAFRAEHQYSLPMAADPERAVYSLVAHNFIPRTYLVGREGTIRYAGTGYSDEGVLELKNAIERELQTSSQD